MATSDGAKKYTKEELQEKLTQKEKAFCHQYIIDWNGSRAAREAGYSEKTATEIAHQNLLKLHIQQYIDYIKNDFEKECGISKARQLNELVKIAYSNISNLHDNWIELKDWENIKNDNPDILNAVESIDTKTESKQSYNQDSDKKENLDVKYVKIKLYSKISAIDLINKMMGYNEPEKIDHSGNVNIISLGSGKKPE